MSWLPWNIEEVELAEGSRFYNRRLEVTPNENWQEGLRVDETRENIRLLFRHLAAEYWYDRIRVYFQHIDTYELIRVGAGVPTQTLNLNFESVDNAVLQNAAHINNMSELVYVQLLLMSDQYSDDNDDLMDRYIIIVDLHVNEQYGGCGTGGYPAYFPPEFNRDTLYNPGGGNCALKCLYYHFHRCAPRDDAAYMDFARARGFPLDTESMLHDRLADAVCAATGVRVVVVNTNLDLKYAVGAYEESIVLMLSGKHYYYVYDLAVLVKMRWGEQSWLCQQCGKVRQPPHDCSRFSEECHKCGKPFTGKQMKYDHKKPSKKAFDRNNAKCEGCGVGHFVSKACYNYHTTNCEAYEVWKKSLGNNIHCSGCDRYYYEFGGTHECYFERYEQPDKAKYPGGIYVFDFESMFSDADDRGARKHTVNYVVVKKLFDNHFEAQFDTLPQFAQWLATECDCEEAILMLAHNFRGYDGRLLLAELVKHNPDEITTAGKGKKGELQGFITVGSKLNSFTWGNITFADSLLHIAQPLHQFPKIFGLDIACKGFFPYEFNVAANQNYVGEIPTVDYFHPEKMSEKRRGEFLRWYDEVKSQPYDFRAEMIKYCVLDVDIMKRGLEVYIGSAREVCEGLNPLETFTVASSAYRIWRTLHMPENVLSYYGASYHETARNALRGGRTDVRCLYRTWTPYQVFVQKKYGVYADVQSMYPYIQMTKPLPVGHPNRIYKPTREDINGKLGFVKCSLAPPPTFQFHPAICVRDEESGRLVAPLRESMLKNIFITTVEFEQAMRQGYEVRDVKYLDYYKESTELFKNYIRTFLKIKVEKSQDYPGDAKFAELREMYRKRCGIELERDNFENNPGMKQIAKLYLNSLWGKLCERAKFDRMFHVAMEGFFQLEEEEEMGLFTPKLKLKLNNEYWLVRGTDHKQNRHQDERSNRRKTSPAVGSYITMYGRSMLLEQMEQLGKRALYHDTDSIVYERAEGEYNIPLGKCLGDWEDELKGKPMIAFVALAPKTYAYRYLD